MFLNYLHSEMVEVVGLTMIFSFLVGNNVLESLEANLENFLLVSASRLSIYNFFKHLDLLWQIIFYKP